ncbi:hypothetical protein C8R43DRAFT_1141342 [Mycena crocata]|nr:hypothetical protein C8R43DRAFT_1141342 [Mycena crocata]
MQLSTSSSSTVTSIGFAWASTDPPSSTSAIAASSDTVYTGISLATLHLEGVQLRVGGEHNDDAPVFLIYPSLSPPLPLRRHGVVWALCCSTQRFRSAGRVSGRNSPARARRWCGSPSLLALMLSIPRTTSIADLTANTLPMSFMFPSNVSPPRNEQQEPVDVGVRGVGTLGFWRFGLDSDGMESRTEGNDEGHKAAGQLAVRHKLLIRGGLTVLELMLIQSTDALSFSDVLDLARSAWEQSTTLTAPATAAGRAYSSTLYGLVFPVHHSGSYTAQRKVRTPAPSTPAIPDASPRSLPLALYSCRGRTVLLTVTPRLNLMANQKENKKSEWTGAGGVRVWLFVGDDRIREVRWHGP